VERAIIYDPETGEILGSHSFGATGQVSEQTSRRFEALLRSQIDMLEKRHGCKLAVHRSSESKQLHTLHHHIDPSTGRAAVTTPELTSSCAAGNAGSPHCGRDNPHALVMNPHVAHRFYPLTTIH